MKKIIVFSLLLVVCGCCFATNSSVGVYGSLYSVQSSKNLADPERCSSVYGLGAKANYTYTFINRVINWSLGADVDVSDYFYSKKANKNDFTFSAFATGGVNLIDNEKALVSFNLGLGPHINVVGGKSDTSFSLLLKGVGLLHMYNNISIGAQLEGVFAFMKNSKKSFEFKTFVGVEFGF